MKQIVKLAVVTLMLFLFSLLLAGCQTNPSIVASLEELATPENCFWHGVDIPDGAVPTGTIVIKNEPWHVMGDYAALERECGEIYGTLLGGCVKNINGGDFPDSKHEYEVVFTDECGAVHEACHARYEVGNGRHSIPSFIRQIQGDPWFYCPPTYSHFKWEHKKLPEFTDPRVRQLSTWAN